MLAPGFDSGFSRLLSCTRSATLGACGGGTSTGVPRRRHSAFDAAGTRVTFASNNGRTHDLESEPQGAYRLSRGNSIGTVAHESHPSSPLDVARSYGNHDHEQRDTGSLQGTITIQLSSDSRGLFVLFPERTVQKVRAGS
jgi:hypothetical protein